jgi:hypothetical protein
MRDAPCSTHFPNASLIVGSASSFILAKAHIQQDVAVLDQPDQYITELALLDQFILAWPFWWTQTY